MSPALILSPQVPWPGLRSFGEDEREFFFGRERETAELVALVQRAVVVVVYGQSGLGKTSLLQAGLFPAVRDAGLLPVRLRLDHGEHAASMSTQVKAALTAALDAAGVTGPRPNERETLWEYFHRRDVDLWGARNRLIKPLIAFDQFEEVFTIGQRSEAAIARVAALTAELESLLEHRAPDAVRARLDQRPEDALKYDFQREGVKFIISLREDFLAQLDTWRTRMPSLLPYRFRLERMTGAQALDVVQRAGGELVDAAVAREIVDFVSRSQRRAQVGALQARNVEPALLSVVCDELNRRRIDRQQPRITPDLLSGERQGIIQTFYSRAFEDVDARARDWIEDELLTASGYRDRAAQEDALRAGVKEVELDRLVDRRILHREERDGVVWLELTHDLLTDPAFASRTQREQRRLADEARRREAETAHQLRRTRRLAAGFAVLSLAMVVAVFFAFRMSSRAAEAQASMQQQFTLAQAAQASASEAATRAEQSAGVAKAEAARASTSFSTAMGMAQPLGQTLHDFVHGDMRLLTPAVLEIITRTDDSYRLLEAQDPGATADQHARFLATAAQALCDVGHLTECLTRAEQAVAILDAEPVKDAPGRRAIRAEAIYARAAAAEMTGRQAQARRDYADAMALAQAEATSAGWTVDLARITVLSELGLGELDRWGLSNASAETHYERALTIIDGRQVRDADQEKSTWRVQALMGLAASVTDPAEQDRRYAKADEALQKLAVADPDNLRLLRLSAEMGLLRGWTDKWLGRSWVAVKFAEKGEAASVHLTQHDRDNLQFKLSWVRSQRVMGVLDRERGQAEEAAKVFERSDKTAAELVQAEPLWRQARYSHGTSLYERAQTDLGRGKALHLVLPLMEQSRAEFEAGSRRAPGDAELIRAVTLATGGMATGHFGDQDYDEIIRLAKQALQSLAPIERGANTDSNVLSNKAYYLGLMGYGWSQKKSWKEATDAYASRAVILESVAARSRLPGDESTVAGALLDLGRTWLSAGDATKAAAQFERASDALTRAFAAGPASTEGIDQAVSLHHLQAGLEKNPAAALDHLQAASDLTWTGLQQSPWNTTLQADLTSINKELAALKTTIGKAALPAAQSTPLLARLNPLIADRQVWKLVDWVVRPLMPGSWINLADSEGTGTLLSQARQLVVAAYPRFVPDQIFAVRILPLSFRTNDVLYEAGVEDDNGGRGVVAFVVKPQMWTLADPTKPSVTSAAGRPVLIDGSFSAVNQLNTESPPRLDTQDRATAFLKFFLGAFHPAAGPYSVVERDEDILWRPDASDTIRADVRKQLAPLHLVKQPNGSWNVDCTMVSADTLYAVTLTMTAAGVVENDHFKALEGNLPVLVEYLDKGVKTLRDVSVSLERVLAVNQAQLTEKPTDRKLLQDTTALAVKLGHWKEAAATQQRLTDVIRADKTATAELSGAYVSLSWYQLFARDFAGALASTDAGRRAEGSGLPIETNRAHALLFLGRIPEADAIYRAHIGQKVSAGSDQLWEQVILQDLDDLEKAGLTHPDFARIRKMMAGKL